MVQLSAADETKRLALKFILENAEYRKRCLYLQEIIGIGRKDDTWRRALSAYFDSPVHIRSFRPVGKN